MKYLKSWKNKPYQSRMIYSAELFFKNETGDFPGGPVIKTSSNAGGADLIPG